MRRKAERGRRRRRRRRPPQRCGPRPSPQVTGRPSPSLPDPPLSSRPGGPETATVSRARVPQGPCLRKHGSAFLRGPAGSGGAWPRLGGESAASIGSVPTRSSPWELPGPGVALSWQPGGGGGSGAELDNSGEEFGPA